MREQTQRLQGAPSTEVQSGVLQGSVTQNQTLPTRQLPISKGQKLAEALGMVAGQSVKAVATIAENDRQEQNTIDSIEYKALAKRLSTGDIEEIEQLDVTEKPKAYANKLEARVNELEQQYRNKTISKAAFTSYVGTLTSEYGKYENLAINSMVQMDVKDRNEKANIYLSDSTNNDYSKLDVNTLSRQYIMSKPEIAKTWLTGQISNVRAQYDNGEITAQEAKDKVDALHKTMTTKEQPDVWKSSVYVDATNLAKEHYQSIITKAAKEKTGLLLDGEGTITNLKGGSAENPQQAVTDLELVKQKAQTVVQTSGNAAEVKSARKVVQQTEQLQFEYNYLGQTLTNAIKSGNYDQLKNHIETDTNVGNRKITAGTAKTFVQNSVNRIDNNLDKLDVSTEEGKVRFNEQLKILAGLNSITGIKSKYLSGFEEDFTNNFRQVKTVDQAKKMLLAGNLISDSKDKFFVGMKDKAMINQLSAVIDDTTLDDKTKLDQFNKIKMNYNAKRNAMILNSQTKTKEYLDNYNSEFELLGGKFGNTRADKTMMYWALQRSGVDPNDLEQSDFNDVMYKNTIIYSNRTQQEGIIGGFQEGVKMIVSKIPFVDTFDSIVLPNVIGKYDNTNNAIEKAVDGLLLKLNKEVSEVEIMVHSNSVSFYDKETKKFLVELNESNLPTFADYKIKQ